MKFLRRTTCSSFLFFFFFFFFWLYIKLNQSTCHSLRLLLQASIRPLQIKLDFSSLSPVSALPFENNTYLKDATPDFISCVKSSLAMPKSHKHSALWALSQVVLWGLLRNQSQSLPTPHFSFLEAKFSSLNCLFFYLTSLSLYIKCCIITCCLTRWVHSEKCVGRWFCCCVNFRVHLH